MESIFQQKKNDRQRKPETVKFKITYQYKNGLDFTATMNTATKVGEIFTKAQAGDQYNKIGDMIIMLAPAAHELIAIDEKNAIYYDVSFQNIKPLLLINP